MVHGRYTVVRKLAEGGMAEIFLARQHGSEGFERLVVLKRIHSGFVADEQFRNMLIDEAHISMGLHHNNIVQVLDLGRAGGRLFLVLELVDGWDLAWLLERALAAKRPLPTGLGLYVIVEVCRALAYAHGRTGPKGDAMGIVHRDISPQNVLLSEQGEVKLADFGIAKAMTKRDRTATGVVKGKIAFMSPEQALGQGIDARSDLFSLGTMLYLVSVGVRPFEANTDFEVLARVQKGQFTPPEDVRPELAPSLTAVIRRVMAVDREHRYQTADELLVDLEGIWRSEFGAPGETEMKLWLGELGRFDGVPPIGKISFATNTRSSGTHNRADTGDLEEGHRLELGDDEQNERGSTPHLATLGAIEEPEIGGPGPAANIRTVAARANKTRGGRPPRMTGNEPTTMSDLALSVSDESMEMMPRMAGRNRRRMVGTGFVALVLLGGAGAAAMWKMGTRSHEPEADPPVSAGAPPVVVTPPTANPALPAPTPLGAPPPKPSLTTAPQSTTPEPPRSPTGQITPPAGQRPAAVPGRGDAGRGGTNAVESERVRLWREREKRWGSGRPGPGGGSPPPVEIVLPPGSSDPGWKPLPAPTEPPAPPPTQADDPAGPPGPAPRPEDPTTPPEIAPAPAPPAEDPPPKEKEIVIPPPPPPTEPAPTP
jgi:serine/threonine protein kinase